MAQLQRVAVRAVRNLAPASVDFDPRQNVIYGCNGSGKSSLLEAVYLLSAAKSFRTSHLRHLIRYGQSGFSVQAEVGRHRLPAIGLAVEHTGSRTILQANGNVLGRASELARYLPVVLVNTDSHNLVVGGPVQRRRMLDWGVFHVEHTYAATLIRYHHAIKQRNACLRNHSRRLFPDHIWNSELAETAAAIDAARARFFAAWLPWVQHYLSELLARHAVTLRYDRGWPADEAYHDTLQRCVEADRQYGYTRHGPHRANIVIHVAGNPAEQCVSRGQQKLLVLALAYAQAATLNEARGDPCVLLIDDLAAELDAEHRALSLQLLAQLRGQSILSVTEPRMFPAEDLAIGKRFHVEHGEVQEVL